MDIFTTMNPMTITPFILYITLAIVLDVIAVLLARYWTISGIQWILYVVVALYAGVGYAFAKSIKYENMAVAYIIWVTIVAVSITVLGYFIFKERLVVSQLVGVVLAIIAVFLVEAK